MGENAISKYENTIGNKSSEATLFFFKRREPSQNTILVQKSCISKKGFNTVKLLRRTLAIYFPAKLYRNNILKPSEHKTLVSRKTSNLISLLYQILVHKGFFKKPSALFCKFRLFAKL